MKYQVIARKFRPQVFRDVVGQDPIVQTLRNAIGMGRAGHAYLFSGPRGVGKTTMARLLAKALNCAQGPTADPCNACPSCEEIAGGRSIDVLEIDAASNTGVDSIRELRENARYAPSRDRFKIFIIDEVHMLSTSAFNALLKTLEEPPEHIAFIMATTERHKLPATILSRCQQFIFRSIPPEEIRTRLRTIAGEEGTAIGDGALDYVVRAAGGSMRDAQSLLDQIIAFGGQEVTDTQVRDVLGFMPAHLLNDAIEALADRDAVRLVETVGIVSDQGLHLGQFVRELMAEMRHLLLARLGLGDRVTGSDEDRTRVQAHAGRFSEQELIRLFDVLLEIEGELRWTSEPRFRLEVGCIRLARIARMRDLEEVIREIRELPATPASRAEPVRAPGPATASARVGPSSPADPPVRKSPAPSKVKAPEARVRSAVAAVSPSPERTPEPTASGKAEPGDTGPAAKPTPGPRPRPADGDDGDEGSADDPMLESARSEPVVRKFLDVFRGEIAHVKSTKSSDSNEGGAS